MYPMMKTEKPITATFQTRPIIWNGSAFSESLESATEGGISSMAGSAAEGGVSPMAGSAAEGSVSPMAGSAAAGEVVVQFLVAFAAVVGEFFVAELAGFGADEVEAR